MKTALSTPTATSARLCSEIVSLHIPLTLMSEFERGAPLSDALGPVRSSNNRRG